MNEVVQVQQKEQQLKIMEKHSLALLRLEKYLPDFELVDSKKKLFKSSILSNQYHYRDSNGWVNYDSESHRTDWDIETQRILIKCCRDNQCYPASCYSDNLFELRTFSLRESDEQFKYLYHCSDISPDIILNEGLKLRYSFALSKGFPPLIFLSTDRRSWSGKYKYRVELHQQLYFDTNLNHKCRKGNDWFCVLQNIKPKHVSLVTEVL